ncbi:hypothetical protein [Paenibacillus sp. JJ-223]|uniref:hypothetical protein n=1 Tax=Paenibacillus sp. JJ-223 TaxID=2905647 RepID=UPI001F1DFE86|nr:hypothetical protein [Paenibacillus sp. JJ-223]CAH1211597.1 hypothetical protein PAECIP111890_03764 [Paenibacillus sp. JJ-223]
MIHPVLLREDMLTGFRENVANHAYHHVVREGTFYPDCVSQRFTVPEADQLVERFAKCDFPIICHAGSKSTEKFFDYHIALRYGKDSREAYVYEMIVREDRDDNVIRGLQMAFYYLTLDRFGLESIVVACPATELEAMNDIRVEAVQANISRLTKNS